MPARGARGVLVGMSGGVDSAVAALLLKEQGLSGGRHHADLLERSRGGRRAQLLLARERPPGPESGAQPRHPSPRSSTPRGAFYDDVVEYFVSEYAAGRTPNPCAKCNSRVRLRSSWWTPRRLGLTRVATGHYARLVGIAAPTGSGRRSERRISRTCWPRCPRDPRAAGVPAGGDAQAGGARAWRRRPVSKVTQRPRARRSASSPTTTTAASCASAWAICRATSSTPKAGCSGDHEGTYNYTIGQRKGLGIAVGGPAVRRGDRRAAAACGRSETAEEGRSGSRDGAPGLVWHREPGGGPLAIQVRSAGAALPAVAMAVADGDTDGRPRRAGCRVWLPGRPPWSTKRTRVIVAGTITSTTRWARRRAVTLEKSGNWPVV